MKKNNILNNPVVIMLPAYILASVISNPKFGLKYMIIYQNITSLNCPMIF